MTRRKLLLFGVPLTVALIGIAGYVYYQPAVEKSVINIEDKYADREPDFYFEDTQAGPEKLSTSNFVLVAKAKQKYHGKCNFVLVKGEHRLSYSTRIYGSDTCRVTRPISVFPERGEWRLLLIFEESSGKIGLGLNPQVSVFDKTEKKIIKLEPISAVREGNFIKAQANLSNAASGICTFTFTYGTYVVSDDTKIKDSSVCETEIPISKFPYSYLYDMSVLFLGDDEFIYESGVADREVFINIQ